jgi:aryl-alcohol dehydrogenase-like predicted oxidoreductase
LDVLENLVKLTAERGVPLAEFALAWVLRNPDVTSAIIGPRTMEQLEGNLRALDLQVAGEDAARIDAWVPPGTSVL